MTVFPDITMTFETVGAQRGGHSLFADLSFQVTSGDVMWIQGANGIGKTTLLRLAAGLSRPDTGSITWTQSEIRAFPRDLVAFQGHRNALKANLTALEDLRFWSDLFDYSGELHDVLKKVGLYEKKSVPCRALSAGQARRLAIARLIISQKPLWIMDEPAAAMDIAGQSLILGIVNGHIAQGGAAIIASHDKAQAFSGRTVCLTLEPA